MFFQFIMTVVSLFCFIMLAVLAWKKFIMPDQPVTETEETLQDKMTRLQAKRDAMKDKKEEVDVTLNLKATEEEIAHLQRQIDALESAE